MYRNIIGALLLAALATLAGPASALQDITVRDGVRAEAIVSAQDPTRIRVEGARITGVTGNIYSSSCTKGADGSAALVTATPAPVNPQGEFALSCDAAKGEVYVFPMGLGQKPINIFVSTEFATYTLVLRRSDLPADTIVLTDKSRRARPAAGRQDAARAKAAPHVRALKALLQAMAGGADRADVTVEQVNAVRALWAEARFELVRLVRQGALVGEQYKITNISAAPMVMAEQEFDRDDASVLGVAIENMNLLPGESSTVYVLRAEE